MSRLTLLLLCLISLTVSAYGQSKQPTPLANDAARKAEAKADAERIANERRAQARSLLLSLASDARSFRDQMVRARTLARIADALWDTDVERGRELFRKAWEAAGVADQETLRKRNEDIQRQKATTGGGYAIPAYPNVRRDVLQLAARRDRDLGEEFLQRLKDEQQDDVNGGNQRMNLASELLDSGDSERALQFASAELATITAASVDFLSSLREKNAVAADERYAILLDTAARNALSDANTVSLLSSYLFTPHVYVFFHRGSMSYGMMGSGPPPNVAPELRLRFFQTAASVLLRSEPRAGIEETTGLEDQYLVIKRLSPWIEQYAPQELAGAMRTRLDALGSMVRESVRARNPNPTSQSESSDREQTILDKIEHAKTSDERDRLYFDLAQQAAWKADLRARDFAGKIEDTEFRKQALAHIDVNLATRSIRRKNTALALDLVQKVQLTHIQRVWLLTQLAKLLAPTDREKSLSLLDDAMTEARRLEGLDPDRPRALLAIANAQRLIEPARVWDAVFEAVKAANSAEGFTGEDGNLNILFQAKGFSAASDVPEADFDIKGIFSALAKDDYDRSVGLTGGFQREAPRAAAVLAIARSILNEPKGNEVRAKR
jgi:hypothetical protein